MKQRLSDPGRTQGNHHSPDTDANVGSDFEQSEANGAALSLCQVGMGQRCCPQACIRT